MNIRRFLSVSALILSLALVFCACADNSAQGDASPAELPAVSSGGSSALASSEPGPSEPDAPSDAPADAAPSAQSVPLEDGVYSALFTTDGSMFHVNEACGGRGVLTVEGGAMIIHVSLPSKNTLNLFAGTAQDAQAEGAALIEPTLDTVEYDDGETEEVYGFDIPVPYLDEEFDCALVGKKGVWYDHRVSVSDPQRIDGADSSPALADGLYNIEVALSGGSGRASVSSPAELTAEGGKLTATVVWSSPHYEYMTVDGVRYDPVQTEGSSAFVIPVVLDREMPVSALTVAMSEPHLIDYTLYFDSATAVKR